MGTSNVPTHPKRVVDFGEEGQPNLEAILSLQPDLIRGTKMGDEALYQQLSDIAPTFFS